MKPNMMRDEFTDKYYEESNPHNKELFNPNKVMVKTKKMIKLPSTLTRSTVGIPRNQIGNSNYYLPTDESV